MWKYVCSLLLCCTLVVAGNLGSPQHYDYNIRPSQQLAYYHQSSTRGKGYQYPAPAVGVAQLQTPTHSTQRYVQYQQTQQQQYSQYQPQQQYQPQPQPQYQPQPQPQQQQQTNVVQQFVSPVLDSAAFTQALSNQGYVFGGGAAATTSAVPAAVGSGRSSSLSSLPLAQSLKEVPSLNIKLPLPLGITPVRLGPLPIEPVNSFENAPRGLTSYGTPYPQRR